MEKKSSALCENTANHPIKEKKVKLNTVEFRVRTMRKKDVPQVLEIYRKTGWHTGTNSILTWMQIDPLGFKVAVTDTGKVLGMCAAIRNHQDFYFIGFYIVNDNYRGMGIGYQVWDACMKHIGHRNAGLNAVPEKLEMYRTKGGFPVVENEWLIQENDTMEVVMKPENLTDVAPEGVVIVPFNQSHLPFMFEYDYEVCGYNRELAVELNSKEKDSKTLVAFKEGACVGFATIKRSVQGVPQVGPMYADDPITAEVMLRRLLMSYPLKKGFSMVTFTSNKAANDLVRKIGCPSTHKLPRAYRRNGLPFHIDVRKVFAHFDVNCSPV